MSAVIGLTWPARERSSSFSPSRRTPHSSASGDRALALLEAAEAEGLDDVLAHQVAFAVARQLEDAAARGEDATVLVAGDKPGVRGRVVVVQQLEEEPEPAALARDGLAAGCPGGRRGRPSGPCSSGR